MTRKTPFLLTCKWTAYESSNPIQASEGLICLIGESEFESTLLQYLNPAVSVASYFIYQTVKDCASQLFMLASCVNLRLLPQHASLWRKSRYRCFCPAMVN